MNVKQNRKIPVIIVLVLMLIVVAISYVYESIEKTKPTYEPADANSVYQVEEGTATLIANGKISELRGIWMDKKAYLPLGVVQNELNDHFYWDDTEKLLIVTTAETITQSNASSVYNDSPIFFEQKTDADDEIDAEERVYVSLDYVAQYTNMQVDSYTDPARVFIRTRYGECTYGTAGPGAAVRVETDIKSPVLAVIPEGTRLWVISQADGWAKVYADGDAGHVGYMRESEFAAVETVQDTGPYQAPEYTRIALDEPVCLVWHQVFYESGLDSIEELLEHTEGLNVLAPTWFSIVDSEGTVESRANQEYVDKAHERGLQIWALVENINAPEPLDNAKILNTTSSRTKVINTLIQQSLEYGIDGINVDLEGLPSTAGDGYIQFIRELSVLCRKNGLILSVDNYVPSAWTTHYQRDKQAEAIDYLIIMGYDEHYSGSDAGSTASLGFVRSGIEDTIAEGVPAEKIVNALPFYSRIWEGEGSGLTSGTISMPDMTRLLERYSDTVTWDGEIAQYYLEYEEDSLKTRVWIEDLTSLQAKLDVMKEYPLAGVAGWKLGMESNEVWSYIAQYVNGQ